MNKKWLIIGALGVIAVGTIGFVTAKKRQASILLDNLDYRVSAIKDVRISGGDLVFKINIKLINSTAQDFSVSSGTLITAKAYRIKHGQEIIASGTLNLSKIELPAGGTFTIENIQVAIPLTTLLRITTGRSIVDNGLMLLSGGYNQLYEEIKNKDWSAFLRQLRYEMDVEAFGMIYHFGSNL